MAKNKKAKKTNSCNKARCQKSRCDNNGCHNSIDEGDLNKNSD